jgi:uncharacterized membrane protein YesL
VEFRGMMGGFYRLTEWIMRFSVTNVLWVLCSLPFFFVLVLLFSSNLTPDLVKQTFIIAGIVAPFTLVPATAAMFVVVRKWITGDTDVPLLKTFFRGYKENYRQSMIGGIVFMVFGLILYVNYTFYIARTGYAYYMSFLFIGLLALLGAAFINFFSVVVHFHMKLTQVLKNAILITIGNPLGTVFLLVGNAIILYFSFRYTFLIPFFMGALMTYLSFWQFNRSYQSLLQKHEKMQQQSEESAEKVE